MPGTLMFEACLQTMAFYLAAMGVTLRRDGWRFEPVPGETYKLLCRGQVTPDSRNLVYEVFVEEFVAGPIPTLYADLSVHRGRPRGVPRAARGAALVPDWPLEEPPAPLRLRRPRASARPRAPLTLSQLDPAKPVAIVANGPSKGFRFDYASLVACAWGRPSDAFGKIYERFDSPRKVARLPGPPYHFMSRIASVEGAMGEAKAGAKVEVEYDVPADAWYFASNGFATMPMCVLMEAALQPCGWLASYVGCALLRDEDLLFRNLDGKGTLLADVLPTAGTLRTVAKLTGVSLAGSMIIVNFEVRCAVGETPVYALDTVFGFFPMSAFENQAGLPTTPSSARSSTRPAHEPHRPRAAGPRSSARAPRASPTPFLLMLDRVVHVDLKGGRQGPRGAPRREGRRPGRVVLQGPLLPGPGAARLARRRGDVPAPPGVYAGVADARGAARAALRGRRVGEDAHVWKYRGQVVP